MVNLLTSVLEPLHDLEPVTAPLCLSITICEMGKQESVCRAGVELAERVPGSVWQTWHQEVPGNTSVFFLCWLGTLWTTWHTLTPEAASHSSFPPSPVISDSFQVALGFGGSILLEASGRIPPALAWSCPEIPVFPHTAAPLPLGLSHMNWFAQTAFQLPEVWKEAPTRWR